MQLLYGIILAGSVSAVAACLGTFMLTRRMTLTAGALGHITIPGAAFSILYGIDTFWGSLVFLILGAIFIWVLELKTKLPFEAVTAVVFAASLSTAFLFLPEKETHEVLIGNISNISLLAVILTATASIAMLVLIIANSKNLILINISKDLARVEGISVTRQNLLYLLCIALVITLGARIVGGLLTAALVAIPACSGRIISKNFSTYLGTSIFIGTISGILGIIASHYTSIPAGPLIIISSTIIFLISVIFR